MEMSSTAARVGPSKKDSLRLSNNREWIQKICIFCMCVVPVVAMLIVTTSIIFQRTSDQVNSEKAGEAIKFSIEAIDVIHYLQIERDMTASYQSSFNHVTKTNLVEQYLLTDAALDRLSVWPIAEEGVHTDFKTKRDFLIYLNQFRYEMNSAYAVANIEMESFTAIINQLDAWFSRAVLKAKSVSTWKELVALQYLFDANKAFATEVAYGTRFFTNGGFISVSDYVAFAQIRAIVNISLESAISYSEVVRDRYLEHMEKNLSVTNQITTMRNDIFNRSALPGKIGESSRQLTISWFYNATGFMNELFKVVSAVNVYIAAEATNSYKSGSISIITLSIFFCVIAPFCFLVGNVVLSQLTKKNEMEFYAEKSSQTRNDGDAKTNRTMCNVIKSRLQGHGNTAKKMASGCRSLPQVGILVAEVVGIPRQMSRRNFRMAANVIKAFDRCLDSVASRHNVIQKKDGYTVTVASGVATDTCHNQAALLVQFAIDLLQKVEALPLINNHRLLIRIGINAGTIEAGVIEQGTDVLMGYFSGRPVSVAESVAAMSKENEILVTNHTYQLLLYHVSIMEKVEESNIDIQDEQGPNYWIRPNKHGTSKASGFTMTSSGTSWTASSNYERSLTDMAVYDIE